MCYPHIVTDMNYHEIIFVNLLIHNIMQIEKILSYRTVYISILSLNMKNSVLDLYENRVLAEIYQDNKYFKKLKNTWRPHVYPSCHDSKDITGILFILCVNPFSNMIFRFGLLS